jgi:hypothetical protein
MAPALGDESQAFDALELSIADIQQAETNKGVSTIKPAQEQFPLARSIFSDTVRRTF